MLNWKAVFIFICIFLAGGVAGGFVGMRVGCNKNTKKTEPSTQTQSPPRRPVEEWSKRFQKDFATKVGITPEQQVQIDPLIQAAQVEFRQLREQFGQHAADVTERLDGQIIALLTPEQKVKYEQIITERHERMKKMEAERAARGDHPPKPVGPPPPMGDKQSPQPSSTADKQTVPDRKSVV
jgi:Spy/CpxP family protein refolding chaperone